MSKIVRNNSLLGKVWPILGIAKPRMTQSDRWKKRPIVLKYRAYKDELRAFKVQLDMEVFYHIIFIMPIPKSWSAKKRSENWYRPHQQTPDKDNLEKGILDALFNDDARAWDGRVTKVWGPAPYIIISTRNMDVRPRAILRIIEESK